MSVGSNVAIDDDDDLPDPRDDRFLNSLFSYAAMREDQVEQLGIELRVEKHRISNQQGNTVLQAIEVCRQWRNLHPEDCEDKRTACNTLAKALEKCGLSRAAIKKLMTKERHKSAPGKQVCSCYSSSLPLLILTGLDRQAVLRRLECIRTYAQLYTFAYHLGYQTSEVDTTLSHSYSSRVSSKMKAFRIFEEWKANSKKPDDIMVKELEQALAAVEKDNPDINEVQTKPKVVVTTVGSTVEPPKPEGQQQGQRLLSIVLFL